jgi:hypothetical protein
MLGTDARPPARALGLSLLSLMGHGWMALLAPALILKPLAKDEILAVAYDVLVSFAWHPTVSHPLYTPCLGPAGALG